MTIRRLKVAGTPAPKGSLKCIGRGRKGGGAGFHQLVEDDKTGRGKIWRRTLTQGAGALRVQLPAALDGPVWLAAVHIVPRPASAKSRTLPWTRSAGDVDKLARMTLDAITDAEVLVDDSRVVFLVSGKVHETPEHRPGLYLLAWTATETLAALRHLLAEFPDLA